MAVDDEYTVSLLHFNGADGDTIFKDESGKVWTANGNAQLDTAQKVFGTASGLFDGTGDYIETPAHADFEFGTGAFAIDFRFRRNFSTSGTGLLGAVSVGNYNAVPQSAYIGVQTGKYGVQVRLHVGASGTEWVFNVPSPYLSNDTWYHLAIVRSGTSLKVYLGGTQIGTTQTSSHNLVIQDPSTVGLYGASYWAGNIDELRISNIARWTANFTPPTEEYKGATPAHDYAGWNPDDCGDNIQIDTGTFLTATHT